jgi:hypothetical protein
MRINLSRFYDPPGSKTGGPISGGPFFSCAPSEPEAHKHAFKKRGIPPPGQHPVGIVLDQCRKQIQAIACLRTSSATNTGPDKDKRQRAASAAFAKAHGYRIVEELYDTAVSEPPSPKDDGFWSKLNRSRSASRSVARSGPETKGSLMHDHCRHLMPIANEAAFAAVLALVQQLGDNGLASRAR